MDENHINEVLGRLKSASIQVRLEAIQEAQKLFTGFFNGTDNLAEWSKKALIVETYYNIIREELKQQHVKIGKAHDETADVKIKEAKASKLVKPKKATGPKDFDFTSMAKEFGDFLKPDLEKK
jgi:hypothetical protein